MLKTYLHSARALMLSRWIYDNHQRAFEYPLDFDDLLAQAELPGNVAQAIASVLDWKRGALDSKSRYRIEVLDDWIASEFEILERIIPSIPDYPMIDPDRATAILLDCYGISPEKEREHAIQPGLM